MLPGAQCTEAALVLLYNSRCSSGLRGHCDRDERAYEKPAPVDDPQAIFLQQVVRGVLLFDVTRLNAKP